MRQTQVTRLPASWTRAAFGDCAEFINGRAHAQDELLDAGTPVLRIQNLNGGDRWYYSDLALPENKYCNSGDLLFAWSASFGPYLWKGPRSIFHYHIWRVIPRESLDKKFAFHLLAHLTQELKTSARGIAMLHLTKSGIEALEIALPPLNEQQRIAAILDQADNLRRKRREAIDKAGMLPSNLFLELFGDWTRPGFNGRLVALGDKLDFLTSGSRGWAAHYRDSGSLFLRIQNVKRDELDLSDVAYVEPPKTAEAQRTRVQSGDVLLSITADLGRTAVVPGGIGEAYINQHLSILRSSNIEPRYLSAAIASRAGQIAVQARNREGVKAGLNFDDVRSLKIPDADITLQRTFAARVAEIDKLKAQHRAHLIQLDTLFASLQHRAFCGEL